MLLSSVFFPDYVFYLGLLDLLTALDIISNISINLN
jgi:hypothetical protein